MCALLQFILLMFVLLSCLHVLCAYYVTVIPSANASKNCVAKAQSQKRNEKLTQYCIDVRWNVLIPVLIYTYLKVYTNVSVYRNVYL